MKKRLATLDVLRLVAIMLVIGRHLSPALEGVPRLPRYLFLIWQRGGWVGVDLFFVLSGFLVSGLLFSEFKTRGRISISRFYLRRGWKIYPPFLLLIAITVARVLWNGDSVPGMQLAAELLFLQSYVPGLWSHTWSLGVEEHFYLLLPLVAIRVLKSNEKTPATLTSVVRWAIGIACLELGARLANWWYRPAYSHLTHLFPSHLRLDALCLGVAIAYAYHFHTRTFVQLFSPWRRWLVVGGSVLFAPAFIFQLETTPFLYTAGLTVFSVAGGMVLVGGLLCALPRTPIARLAARLGEYSYSIYLWHLVAISWGGALLGQLTTTPVGFVTNLVFSVVASIVLGVSMGHVVEMPLMRLRQRLLPPYDGKT